MPPKFTISQYKKFEYKCICRNLCVLKIIHPSTFSTRIIRNSWPCLSLTFFLNIYFSSIKLPNKYLFNSPNNFNHVKWLVFYQQQQGHNKVTKLSTTKTKTTTCLHRTTARPIRHPFLPTLLHHRSRQATVTMATTTTVILGNHHRQGNFTIQ